MIIAEQSARKCPFHIKAENSQLLQWEGEPIELVEVMYALYSAGSFSKITLKELFSMAGELFGCKVRNFYSLFSTIKSRTKGDRTTFLDKLKRSLIVKMEKSDARPSRK